MTATTHDTQSSPLDQAEFQALLHEKLRQAIRLTLVTILDEEVEAFIGAGPYLCYAVVRTLKFRKIPLPAK